MTTKRGKAPKSTILLVEDEPILASLYISVLRKLKNAEIITAAEEEEALGLVAKRAPSLIILDLMIPTSAVKSTGIGFHEPVGFDVLKKIKRNPKTKSTRVIILSNLDADEHRHRAEALGAEEYIVKAMIEPRELAEKIAAYLK